MGGPAVRKPVDEKLYGCMMDFVHRTVSLRRAWVLYGRGNAMLEENLNNWRAAADVLFQGRESLEITTAGNKLFFGETLLESDSPFTRELVEILRRLAIRRLTLVKGIEGSELYQLMDMISQEGRALLVKGGPAGVLREAGVKKIRVVENVYMKRAGQAGEIVLDEGKLTLDDLGFIKGQLKNMLALARDGGQLRADERALLAEAAEQPAFMAELMKEMAGGEPGEPPPTPRVQGDNIAELLDAFLTELRRGGKDEGQLRASISDTMRALDEDTRLETLAAGFESAGLIAPVLDKGIFDLPPAQLGQFIVGMAQRDPKEAMRATSLLRRLIPDEAAYKAVAECVKAECGARGADAAAVETMLRDALGPLTAPAPVAMGDPVQAAREIAARFASLAAVTTSDLTTAFTLRSEEAQEVHVLEGLLRAKSATPALVVRGSVKIREFVKDEGGAEALILFRALLFLLRTAADELKGAARDAMRGLCTDNVVVALLRLPAPAEERVGLMEEIVQSLPPADAAAAWGSVLADAGAELHEVLLETAKRQARTVADLLRRQMVGGSPEVVARSLDILRTLPDEHAIPILVDLCSHPDAPVRLKAVSALGKSGRDDVMPCLQTLVKDPDREVRRTAIPLLGQCGGEASARTLLGIVSDAKAGEERALACRALAKCGGRDAVPALAALVREAGGGRGGKDSQMLLSSARFALESIGGPEAQAALSEEAPRAGRRSFFKRIFRKE